MAPSLHFFKRKKFWKRFFWFVFISPILLFTTLIFIIYVKQDPIIKELIQTANSDLKGAIRIKDSHVEPFANFPYISIDLEDLEIFETGKFDKTKRIIHVKDTYIGFDIVGLLKGNYDIKSIRLSDGDFRIVQHENGEFNVAKAFETKKPVKDVSEEFHLDLKSVILDNIDISKLNEENGLAVSAYVTKAKTAFKTTDKYLSLDLDSKFELSLMQDGDSTFINHKHFEVETHIDLDNITQLLKITDTEVILEGSSFGFGGTVDFKDSANLNLHFTGKKPNFDLFIGMAPNELIPTLKQFDNKGDIFFDATIKGKSMNGHRPAIKANFGCDHGYISNIQSHKKLEEIGFRGTFTNGKNRDISTMKFELDKFKMKPEAGIFKAKLTVKNFESPDIDLNLVSDFDLDFLARFLNTKELKGLSGRVILTMNFHDIIDLNNPEKSIALLNESYYSKLEIKKLKFKSSSFHLPLDNLDLSATMEGHKANIEKFDLKIGKSDLRIVGFISDLPAIIHHVSVPVAADLKITSNKLDIKELTSGDKKSKPIDEQIENLSLSLKVLSSAKEITESKTLPLGEFIIEDLYAKLKHYPHTLHDFHADFFINENDLRIEDFSGMVDKSDFHFSGKLDNYAIWFDEKMVGETRVALDLNAKKLQFDNLFTHGGEQFIPEDYRHEELDNLKLHGVATLHFQDVLKSTDFQLTQFNAKMKVHPLKLEQFSGHLHYENDFLSLKELKGKMGHSNFNLALNYNLSKEKSAKKNFLNISSTRIDLDELLNYNAHPSKGETSKHQVNHDDVFSIYDFDFPEIDIKANISEFDYKKYILRNFKADIQSESNHMIHVSKLAFDASGGHFDIAGYLSGKDKKHIYFKPDIKVKDVDLDQFMVKFDNFGQDYLVSENLHGKFTGKITGKIHLHADLVPKIDDSELAIEMTILKGRLENYSPILALSDYFDDNKLKSVVFDTLHNTLTLKKSVLTIPIMTINSNLGFMEITGNQKIDDKMDLDYLIGVPWKMLTQVAGKKIFKRSKSDESSPEEIQYRKDNSKFVYVKMTGDIENYKVGLSKKNKKDKH